MRGFERGGGGDDVGSRDSDGDHEMCDSTSDEVQ